MGVGAGEVCTSICVHVCVRVHVFVYVMCTYMWGVVCMCVYGCGVVCVYMHAYTFVSGIEMCMICVCMSLVWYTRVYICSRVYCIVIECVYAYVLCVCT